MRAWQRIGEIPEIPARLGMSSMSGRGLGHTVGRLIDRSKEPSMKKSLAVTIAVAAVILVTAFAALAVLTALAGQKSGLEKSSAAMAIRFV
jgi:hypothetical protein